LPCFDLFIAGDFRLKKSRRARRSVQWQSTDLF